MTEPCGQIIGHGERCSSGWLCSDCKEKSQIAEQERAAIVAWLRKSAKLNPHRPEAQALVILFSNAIEDGEHQEEQSK
jgi:hypothetical protein